MFYAHFVLAKKGPMARIWLAAHWDKKLTKAHVYETNIEKSVEGILQPKVKMALRTTGHLLLGIVRIYSRKAKYLLADCNEAFVKIKMAFRPGMVDLPEENREAAVNAITLPEVFHDFDTVMPHMDDLSIREQLSISQVMRVDEITLREEYGTIAMDFENGFGEMPGAIEEEVEENMSVLRDSVASEQLREGSLLFNDDSVTRPNTRSSRSKFLQEQQQQSQLSQSQSREQADQALTDLGAEPSTSGGGLFDDLGELNQTDNRHDKMLSQSPHLEDTTGNAGDNFDPPSPGGLSSFGGGDFSRPSSPFNDDMPAPSLEENFQPVAGTSGAGNSGSLSNAGAGGNFGEQTTLLHNEDESFALEPVDASAIRGQVRPKRKRKLVVDEIKAISGEDMKSQLSDTYDIVAPLDLAPPTKKLMFMKEVGATEKLFSLPVRIINSKSLVQHFQVNALLPASEAEELFGLLGDSERDGFILDHVPGQDGPDTPSKRGRKRKLPAADDQPANTRRQLHLPLSDKENMPPPPATPARMATPAHPGTPAHTPMATPVYMATPGRMATPVYMTTPGRMATPAYMATPGHPSTPAYMPTPGNMGNTPAYNMGTPSHDFEGFDDNYDIAGAVADWATPLHEGPTSILPFNPETSEAQNPTVSQPESSVTEATRENDSVEASELEEEMLEGETLEAYEERVLNKRAGHLNAVLKSTLNQKTDKLSFSQMAGKNLRKQVAQKFYSLLVLQKALAINVQQEEENGEIFVSRGPRFETAVF